MTNAATDQTLIKIGAASVVGSAGSDEYGISGGQLGVVIFRKTSTGASQGYALDGSLTGFAKLGGSVSAQATVKVRRNTTTFAVNEIVPVKTVDVPVVFTATEIAKNGTAYQTISLVDAIIKIGDITIKGGYESQPNGPNGETITKITNASLEFGSPVLLTLSATSVIYKSFPNSVTIGGTLYPSGVQQAIINGGEIKFGEVLTLFGSFNILRGKDATATTKTVVAFANLGFSINKDGRTMVSVAGDGQFDYSTSTGLNFSRFAVTSFDILPSRQSSATDYTSSTGVAIPTKTNPGTPSRKYHDRRARHDSRQSAAQHQHWTGQADQP